MSINTTVPRASTSRASDDRFENVESANDVNAFQIDESFEESSDPYNSTGRFLATAFKDRNRA